MAQLAAPIHRETGEQGRSHSANFDHRRRPEALRTAMATAFFCPREFVHSRTKKVSHGGVAKLHYILSYLAVAFETSPAQARTALYPHGTGTPMPHHAWL